MTAAEREAAILSLKVRVEKTAQNLVRRLPNTVRLDDLESCGWIGAIHAVDKFRPDGGASLDSFAAPRILGEMLDYLRRIDPLARQHRRRIKRGEAPEVQVISVDAPTPPLIDCRPLLIVASLLAAMDCANVIRRTALTRMERRYLEFYFQGLSDYEIARRIGKSPGRPCQLFGQIVKKAWRGIPRGA